MASIRGRYGCRKHLWKNCLLTILCRESLRYHRIISILLKREMILWCPNEAMVEVHHHFDSEHGLDSDEQHYEFHLTSCVIKINNQNRLNDGFKDNKT